MKKFIVTWDLESTMWVSDSNKLLPIRNIQWDAIVTAFKWNVQYEFIWYNKILGYFANKRKEDEFILSLDAWVYNKNADAYFGVTRVYSNPDALINKPNDYDLMGRNGDLWTWEVKRIVKRFLDSWKKELIITDDGIFSWSTIKSILDKVKEAWVKEPKIRVALNFSWSNFLEWTEIQSMEKAPRDLIVDRIDERDFYYWADLWWASFFNGVNINWLPYIYSKEVVEKKASIPRQASEIFRSTMLQLNIDLYTLLEAKSSLLLKDIPRLNFLQDKYDKNMSIIDVLRHEF